MRSFQSAGYVSRLMEEVEAVQDKATGRVVNALPPVDGSRPARTNQEENVRGSFANGCFPVVVFPDADVPPPRSAWRLGGILNHKQIPPVIRPLNLTVLSRRSSAGCGSRGLMGCVVYTSRSKAPEERRTSGLLSPVVIQVDSSEPATWRFAEYRVYRPMVSVCILESRPKEQTMFCTVAVTLTFDMLRSRVNVCAE
ncbi:Hypothetical protein SMAX5B_019301 [Scophthalmus maximus]|uniref:Uncharacterized protein n=1 Tax=Scophthalmus maximus TaxID=52904 RepID=A0A2U9BWC9_SCOMX|nr:Hypothetical protein SMAX5B_019301 [Scophthalmus maximus]